MGTGEKKRQLRKPPIDELEPYRRLVEIQKLLVKMAKEHEAARRECEMLRDELAREVLGPPCWKRTLRLRIRLSASKLFRRLPRLNPGGSSLPEKIWRELDQSQSSSC